MIQQSRWAEYKSSALVLAACLVFMLIIFFEWQQLSSYEPQSEIREYGTNVNWFGEVPGPVEVLQMPEQYEEIKQRPLFFKNRRPIESDGDELDSYKGKFELVLTGVMVTPDGLSALIRDNKNQSSHLKLGEDIDGWILDTVYAHKIFLKKEGKRKTLILRDSSKRKKTTMPSGPKPSPIKRAEEQKQDEKNEAKN